MKLDCHREIVEQDRHDRNALAHRRLEIHAGEADRGITPDVDAELVRAGELGAHGEAEPVAELGRLSPADVGMRRRRLPERRELVARAAGVVGDDGIGLVVNKMSVREFLQKLGTEAMRDGLHTNVWVNSLFSDYIVTTIATGSNEFDVQDTDLEPKWIITDLRFPNEYDAVADRNGITIRVTRPGTLSGTHPSETALDSYPYTYEISNDGDYNSLLNKVREILVKAKIIS